MGARQLFLVFILQKQFPFSLSREEIEPEHLIFYTAQFFVFCTLDSASTFSVIKMYLPLPSQMFPF